MTPGMEEMARRWLRAELEAATAPLVDKLARLEAMLAGATPRKLDSAALGKLLNKSGPALRMWLARHPSFPREKVGARLMFDEKAVREWLAQHGQS